MKDGTKIEHRFLDEAGDTTFYGKGKRIVLGSQGVSQAFSIGMLEIREGLTTLRKQVKELQASVVQDEYLNCIPSIRKKIHAGGFYFHATDDPPEVRQIFYKFIKGLDVSMEVMVARKIPDLYAAKHNNREVEFYADVLSHLMKGKLGLGRKFVLNIAQKGNCTKNHNLEFALSKAQGHSKGKGHDPESQVVFNLQNQRSEPLLNIVDYLCWAVQRVFERGETRYYDFVLEKIPAVFDLYAEGNPEQGGNCYKWDANPLTPENKIDPHSA